jgi:hypothetical protein
MDKALCRREDFRIRQEEVQLEKIAESTGRRTEDLSDRVPANADSSRLDNLIDPAGP